MRLHRPCHANPANHSRLAGDQKDVVTVVCSFPLADICLHMPSPPDRVMPSCGRQISSRISRCHSQQNVPRTHSRPHWLARRLRRPIRLSGKVDEILVSDPSLPSLASLLSEDTTSRGFRMPLPLHLAALALCRGQCHALCVHPSLHAPVRRCSLCCDGDEVEGIDPP
jgi:hypothetical protein